MKPEETVDYNVKVCWHAISRMYNTEAAKNDITTSIGFVLLNIDQEAGTPATKIAPLLGLEARSLTRILKSMEEKKLIFKVSDPSDKRLVRIFLTKKGLEKKKFRERLCCALTIKYTKLYRRKNWMLFLKCADAYKL